MEQYIVDAFAQELFQGNPAAVCICKQWPSEEILQKIAVENGLSHTAFTLKEEGRYALRWFTPKGEIELCGHATLAAAYVLFRFYEPALEEMSFATKSGALKVSRKGDLLEMEFPAYELKQLELSDALEEALGVRPVELWRARDLLCVLESEEEVRNLKPDLEKVKALKGALLQVTAKGKDYDCVSRTFAPQMGLDEDPVCGSGHCHIIPYWAKRLEKNELLAYQASSRGGVLHCRMEGDRVILGGTAVLYSKAELLID